VGLAFLIYKKAGRPHSVWTVYTVKRIPFIKILAILMPH